MTRLPAKRVANGDTDTDVENILGQALRRMDLCGYRAAKRSHAVTAADSVTGNLRPERLDQ